MSNKKFSGQHLFSPHEKYYQTKDRDEKSWENIVIRATFSNAVALKVFCTSSFIYNLVLTVILITGNVVTGKAGTVLAVVIVLNLIAALIALLYKVKI